MPTETLVILPNGQRRHLDLDPRDFDPKDQWTNRFPVHSSSSAELKTPPTEWLENLYRL